MQHYTDVNSRPRLTLPFGRPISPAHQRMATRSPTLSSRELHNIVAEMLG